MKWSTSGGFTWPGDKRKLTRECCFDFAPDGRMPIFDVKEQVLETYEAYQRNELASPMVGIQLKDEPRKFSKCLDGATRPFAMSPFDHTLCSRQVLMPWYSLMVQHSVAFDTAVGINMHSSDVDDLVERLKTHKNHFDIDFKSFDTSMPTDIGYMASTVRYDFLRQETAYDEEAINMVRGIESDALFPLIAIEGTLVRTCGYQPSGKYGTAEDNSERHACLMMYAFDHLCELNNMPYDAFDYLDHCVLVTYGDDGLNSVSDDVKSFFNQKSIIDYLAKYMDMIATPAIKDGAITEFLPFEDLSFLQRTFVWNGELNHWTAPIGDNSIVKSCGYILPSKAVDIKTQVIDACGSMLRELALKRDEPAWNVSKRKMCIAIETEYGVDALEMARAFPTYHQILESMYPTIIESVTL
jgi:hypothetical protein